MSSNDRMHPVNHQVLIHVAQAPHSHVDNAVIHGDVPRDTVIVHRKMEKKVLDSAKGEREEVKFEINKSPLKSSGSSALPVHVTGT
jgi:hypothetical protein